MSYAFYDSSVRWIAVKNVRMKVVYKKELTSLGHASDYISHEKSVFKKYKKQTFRFHSYPRYDRLE